MAKYRVSIHWKKSSSTHEEYAWRFENGLEVRSAVINDKERMADPESAFVASIASCHMLSLMAIAVKKGFLIADYQDDAIGILEKNPDGRIALTKVMLNPKICFSGPVSPSLAEIERLHEVAHHNCFISNSVTSDITITSQTSL